MSKKLISIVIPAYKEEKNIPLIYPKLQYILKQVSKKYKYEVIIVNDGSPDDTWLEIEKICNEDKKIKGINLSRNFGKEIAITSGIEKSLGDAVITLDGDGQHPINKILDFIEEWENGYDMVYNQRPNTKGISFFKKLSSKIFYTIFNSISEFKLQPGTTDYRLLDKKVVKKYIQFKEKNRLYRGLTDWLGFNKKALIFDADERLDGGVGSYSYKKLFELAVNSMTSFSMFPLKLVGYLGTVITIGSTLLLLIALLDKITLNYLNTGGLAFVIILNTILIGILLIALGLIALYVGKIHEEVLNRPVYIIKDKLNFDK